MEFLFSRFGVLPSVFYALPAGEKLVLHALAQRWCDRKKEK